MITDKDVQKLLTAYLPVFATKEDLRVMEERLDNKMTELRSDVYTKMDQTYKEVKKMREEQAAHQSQHDRIDNDLKKIKSIPIIAHELRKEN